MKHSFLYRRLTSAKDDMRLFIKAASSATSEDAQVFYDLFQTQSWATMMTFAQESARESVFISFSTTNSFLRILKRRLRYLNPWIQIWTSCPMIFGSRSNKWKRWTHLVQGRVEARGRARASESARTVPLRTRTEALIAKCVCYHWEPADVR